MNTITFIDPDTDLDIDWDLKLSEHLPLEENRTVAVAEAGDYIEPDVIYKGSYQTTQFTTNPIPADQLATFNKLVEATKKSGEVTVDATTVPMVGVIYSAQRTGNLRAVPTSSGKHFTFQLNMRVLRIEP